jgi:protein-L-isoaspartate O-methyltransferase
MLASAIASWFGRSHAVPPVAAVAAPVPRTSNANAQPRTPWPRERIALADSLWGEGFGLPGGEVEALRLTRTLGPSPAHSLLLIGGGAGGAACSIKQEFGAWVAALENEPQLVDAAHAFIARSQMGRKVSMAPWQPDKPAFETRKYHHCVALEPLVGVQAEPILDGLARALKPSGQLVMTDLVADEKLDPAHPGLARWAALERRDPAGLQASAAVTSMLGRVGMDVRIAEDISERHIGQVVQGWRTIVRGLRGTRSAAAAGSDSKRSRFPAAVLDHISSSFSSFAVSARVRRHAAASCCKSMP